MTFGTKHSVIFFAEAIEAILRQIRTHSEIKILNYCDDILLNLQDKQILKIYTKEIMRTLEQFGQTISTDKCETEPRYIMTFLGWIRIQKEMNIRMANERKLKMMQALKDFADRQTELPQTPQKRRVSVSNRINQSEDTSVNDGVVGRDNDNKQSIEQIVEMVDKDNRGQPTRIIDQQDNNMHVNKRRITIWLGTTLIYENQTELILHDCWSEKEAEMTCNAKEIKAIYYEMLRFEQVFKKTHDQAVLIRSDNTTAVYDIGKWKAKKFLD
ncbi:MAG: hypothetical protein EZS28_021958 [Streblomastix strix]|uniref:Reverse transcriptase domain-containing protein n=1 Tax=Streblomastix strix TaxID=222440 RepID=A0A5J4VJW0_9EUKA|nr:MAG: hypothetical protein EZS28_021958 [Streblomastix strix]